MFNQILIPVDLVHQEHVAELREAARLLIDGSGNITLLYVDPTRVHGDSLVVQLDESDDAEPRREALTQLQGLAQSLQLENVTMNVITREGAAHDQILEYAAEISADAILMMASRPGLTDYFIGSTAERVVRHADCSVFVIR
ncbi:universal stress protein [Halomonas sp. YLGW01]|uniref:universal stress protein n=1 Tax=Halomonas sp. YLGW01 TaxID=2773308 RepID=UPI001784B155|nr:universal stress protein [Halomonas sp. YLGW01]